MTDLSEADLPQPRFSTSHGESFDVYLVVDSPDAGSWRVTVTREGERPFIAETIHQTWISRYHELGPNDYAWSIRNSLQMEPVEVRIEDSEGRLLHNLRVERWGRVENIRD